MLPECCMLVAHGVYVARQSSLSGEMRQKTQDIRAQCEHGKPGKAEIHEANPSVAHCNHGTARHAKTGSRSSTLRV
jgi:hypothetical protein